MMAEQHRLSMAESLRILAIDFRKESEEYAKKAIELHNQGEEYRHVANDMKIAADACERRAKQIDNAS